MSMASAVAPRRVDGASTAQPGRRAAAARRRRGPPSRQRSGAPRAGAQLHLDKTVPRRSVSALEVLRVKAPVRFQTRAATSGAGLQRRSKAAARRQCQRYQTRTKTGHGARIRARARPLFKKSPLATPARSDLQLLYKIASASRSSREVHASQRVLTPPFSSPSSPFTQCYRRGPFWPASGATARPPVPSESPTCDGPRAPPQRLGPALTPVDAAPRRLPFHEDRYSTWGDPRAVLPSGTRAAGRRCPSIGPLPCRHTRTSDVATRRGGARQSHPTSPRQKDKKSNYH